MDESANIERLRQEIEALHKAAIDKVLEVAKVCYQAERELSEDGLTKLGSLLSFGPAWLSKMRRIGADARLLTDQVRPLLPVHSASSLYEISGWSDDKLEAAISEKVLTPKATRSQLEAFGRAPRSKAKRPGDFLVMIPPPRKEVVDDFMHDADELCEKYGVSLFCPAWDEYLRLWDEREKKVRTYLRKKVRAIVQEEIKIKKASNQEWGHFAEETALHEWYSREQIRFVCELLLRPLAFDGFVIEAERLYPEPDLILPEPSVNHPPTEPRRYFKRHRNHNSVAFHATGEDTLFAEEATPASKKEPQGGPPEVSPAPPSQEPSSAVEQCASFETEDDEVARIFEQAARELEEEAKGSPRSTQGPRQ
jgi:hypothetical protein